MIEMDEFGNDKFNNAIVCIGRDVLMNVPIGDRRWLYLFKDEMNSQSLEQLFKRLIEMLSSNDTNENIVRMALLYSILFKLVDVKEDVRLDEKDKILQTINKN